MFFSCTTTLKEKTSRFRGFFVLFVKVSSAKFFEMRDPRKFIPAN